MSEPAFTSTDDYKNAMDAARLTLVKVEPTNIRFETCTPRLRFVQRDGKRMLQQCWSWTSADHLDGGIEWRDVPLTDETA